MKTVSYSATALGLAVLALVLAVLMVLAPTGQAISFNLNKRVDSGSGNAQTPAVALNSTGTIVVVWSDDRNGNWDVMAARSTNGGSTWAGDTRVDDSSSGDQVAPDIAIAPNNRVHVVWQDGRGTNNHIYYATSTNAGSSFGTNQRVDDSSSGAQSNPAVAANSSTVFVTWEDTRNGHYEIYFSKSTDNGTTWSTNKHVDDSSLSYDARYPDIAVDSSGKIVIVWEDYRNSNWDIYSSVSTDGGSTWSANKRVDDTGIGTLQQEMPSIAVDLDKKFHVMWQDYRNSNYQIFYSNSTTPSTSWSANQRVDDSAGGTSKYPSVTVDINRMVHGIWQDYRNSGNPDIYYSNITKTGTFAANKRVDNSTQGSQVYPAITTDGNANLFLVWQSDENTKNNIYYTRNANKQPNQPTLTGPTNDGYVKTSTPTFTWTFTDPDAGDSQTAYWLILYNSSGTVYDSNVVISTLGTHTLSTAVVDGNYSWAVRTRDTIGAWSFYSSPWTIRIDTVGPVAKTPTDAGKFTNSVLVTFNWPAATDNGSGVAGYYICVGTTPGGCDAANSIWTTTATYTYNNGVDGTTYYAKVKGKDNAGNNGSFGGNSDGITVDRTAPSAAQPTDQGKYTKSTTLKWNWTASSDALSGVAGYFVCIGTTPGGSDVVNNAWTTQLNYTLNNAESSYTYYAKVRAQDNATNLGAYSANSDGITVDLVAPGAARPVDQGMYISTKDVKFWWAKTNDDISGIKGYFVYIGTLPDGSDVVNGIFVTEPNYTYHNGLNGKTYYAYITAQDNATNIGVPGLSSDGVTVDLTVPTAPVTYDPGLVNRSNSVLCWWDASEDQESGVVRYDVQLNLGITIIKEANTTLTTYRFTNATPFLQDGVQYSFRVRALNGAGNWSLWGSSTGFWVDLTISDVKTPTHPGRYSNSTSILWSWPEVFDDPAGIDGYIVDIGSSSGKHDLVSKAWTSTNSYLFTGGTNGQTYFITVTSKDRAGNVANPVSNTTGVTIDNMQPDSGPVYDVGAFSPTMNITFTWDAIKDPGSGVKLYYITIGTRPYLDDVLTASTNKTTYIFKGAVGGKTYYAKVRALDNANNLGAWGPSSDGIQVDTTPPLDISIVSPVLWANSTGSLDLLWSQSTDNVSGVPYYMYALGTTSGGTDLVAWTKVTGTSVRITGLTLQEGSTYYISIKPVNGANLEGKVLKVQVTIDTLPPTAPTSFKYPAFTSNTSISWTWAGAMDDRSGIAGYYFWLGTGPGLKDLVNETFMTTGQYTYNSVINDRSYYATLVPVDKAGNRGMAVLAGPVRVDLLPPRMIKIERASAYSHNRNVTWSWEGTDSISGIDGYFVVVSEGDFTNGTVHYVKGTTYTEGTLILEGHTYYIQIRPKDKAGNLGDFSYGEGITVDTVAPTAIVTINNNASYVNSRVVTLQISSAHKDIAQMLVSNTQDMLGANWQPYAASQVWYLTAGEGSKTVYVVVKDASGQQSPVYKVQVTLKTQPPVLSVDLPADAVSSSSLTVKGKTDPKATVLVNGKQIKVGSDGTFSTNIELKDGTNLISVVATDQAGNEVRVSRAVNKEPFTVPSWVLLVLILVMLIIAIVALAYGYSANKRLGQTRTEPKKTVEAAPKKEPPVSRPPARAPPPVRERPRPEPEPEEEEAVEEAQVEEDEPETEDDELTLEEDGQVTKPDILARIRATEDTEVKQIQAAEANGADEVTFESADEPVKKPIAQVKCNQCANLIPIYTTERPLRIECPKCGKVGMIRK